jgi:hypothetical protein
VKREEKGGDTKLFRWIPGVLVLISLGPAGLPAALAQDEGVCFPPAGGDPGTSENVESVVIDPGGAVEGIVTGGSLTFPPAFTDRPLTIARSLLDCSLDPNFGIGGRVLDRVGTNPINVARIVEVQPNGTIKVRGITQPMPFSPNQYFKGVFTPDGSPAFFVDDTIPDYFPAGVVQQTDGKTMVVGDGVFMGRRLIVIKRENPDFSLDTNVPVDFGPNTLGKGSAITVRNDGKNVVAGGVLNLANFRISNGLASIDPNGTVILTRILNVVPNNDEVVTAVVARGVNGTVGAGTTCPPEGGCGGFLMCTDNNHNLAGADCVNGGVALINNVVPGNDHFVRALARQPSGGVVGVGDTCMPGGDCQPFAFCVNEDLSPKESCGPGGVRIINVGPGYNSAKALAMRSDGSFVVAGDTCSGGVCGTWFACLDSNPSPDVSRCRAVP